MPLHRPTEKGLGGHTVGGSGGEQRTEGMREVVHKFFACGKVVCSVEDYKYKPRRLVTGACRQETRDAECLRHINICRLITKRPHPGAEGT
jgi:hypothetical protein